MQYVCLMLRSFKYRQQQYVIDIHEAILDFDATFMRYGAFEMFCPFL